MAICINCDGICFGTYSITPSPTGICIDGVFSHQGTAVPPPPPTPQQGSINGYVAGGNFGSPPLNQRNTVDRFPFASDTPAVDGGELFQARARGVAGHSSSVSGYSSGGFATPMFLRRDTIDKFPFASDQAGTDVGELTCCRQSITGTASSVSGYSHGGAFTPPGGAPTTVQDVIDKFPFSSDTSATDVGELTQARQSTSGNSSSTNGYAAGGGSPPGPSCFDTIDKYPFSSDTPATDVGEVTICCGRYNGNSSDLNGYTVISDGTIDKFPFSSDTPATDVGELSQARPGAPGQNSTESGYTSGGFPNVNTIDKFPFASDTPASDVGELTQGRYGGSGNQSGGNGA